MVYLQQSEVPAPVLFVLSNEGSINKTERDENKEYAQDDDHPSRILFCLCLLSLLRPLSHLHTSTDHSENPNK